MSKKITLAEWKARAELAEARLEAVMKNLDMNVDVANNKIREATAHSHSVYETRDNAQRAYQNARAKT